MAQRSSCCVSLFSRAVCSLFHAWVQENPMDSQKERSIHTPGIQFKEFLRMLKGTRKWKQPNFWHKVLYKRRKVPMRTVILSESKMLNINACNIQTCCHCFIMTHTLLVRISLQFNLCSSTHYMFNGNWSWRNIGQHESHTHKKYIFEE